MPNLVNVEQCTGCSACANACPKNAIKMIADKEGFFQPIVDDDKCINCGLCERACPALSANLPWGIFTPKVNAGWHNFDRKISSSGGMFSAFARGILSEGGSVFGASLNSDLVCRHIEILSIDDLQLLRGSKYLQSEIGLIFRTIKMRLENRKKVLFCGTPCQVSGLRKFLKKDYENLLTIDLACHGVPSNAVFKSYINKLQKALNLSKKNQKIQDFEFRRRDGWGMFPSYSIDESRFIPVYGSNALYMKAFDKSALFRKSCYSCRYAKIPRIGDITLADFWGIGRHGKPFKYDTMKGVSLVLANTEKGLNAINSLDEDSFIEERTLDEALIENHNLTNSSPRHPQRDEIIQDFLNERMSLEKIGKKYGLTNQNLKDIIKEYSSKLGLFSFVKRIYNKVKSI